MCGRVDIHGPRVSAAAIQRLADVTSAYFVPTVMAIAIATFAVWYIAGPPPALTLAGDPIPPGNDAHTSLLRTVGRHHGLAPAAERA
jgi:cation transport ATPase